MDTTPSTLTAETAEQAPRAPDPTPPVRTDGLLGKGPALLLGLGWPLAMTIAVAVEPPSPNPVPLLLDIFSIGLMLAMGSLIVTAAARRPAAVKWAGVTGGALLFSAIACPVSGHHPGVGAWWFVQLAVIGAMLAATAWVASDRAKAVDGEPAA